MSRTRIRIAGVWVDLPSGPAGPVGPQGALGPTGPSGSGGILTAYASGLLVVGAGAMKLYNDRGGAITIASVRVTLTTAPVGSSAIFDVNLNGVTLFTNQANRPTIPAGSLTSGLIVPDITNWAALQALTADVDAIGSSYAGANATLQIGLV